MRRSTGLATLCNKNQIAIETLGTLTDKVWLLPYTQQEEASYITLVLKLSIANKIFTVVRVLELIVVMADLGFMYKTYFFV